MKVGTKLFLMSAGIALIIMVVGITSLVSLSSLIDSNHSVAHSKDTLQELNQLMFDVADCISAQRGYIISGKEPFLDAYQKQIIATNECVARIDKLVADNPQQVEHVKTLRATVKERLASLETTCELFRTKGSEAAFDRIRSGKSLQFRVLLQKQIDEMKQIEQTVLDQRIQEANRQAFSAEMTVFAGMLLALAFVAVSNFLFGANILSCVKALITASENITYGRFDMSAQTNSNDEFADLAAAFNSMGQQLLLASRQLKEQQKEHEVQQEKLSDFQLQTVVLKAKLDLLSQLSEAETTGLENYKAQLEDLDVWLAKLNEMSVSFQDVERTSQQYVQRITFFNEGATKTVSSLQSELDFRQDVDHATMGRSFRERVEGLNDLTQAIDKLIGGIELITIAAEMEAARAPTADKTMEVFISTLKEKTIEAKNSREQVQKYIAELNSCTGEVLERYRDLTTKLVSSRQNAARISHDLDKQTELCLELKIMFADSILQKYVAFVSGKRSFTQDLKDDVTMRTSLATQLSEIATSHSALRK